MMSINGSSMPKSDRNIPNTNTSGSKLTDIKPHEEIHLKINQNYDENNSLKLSSWEKSDTNQVTNLDSISDSKNPSTNYADRGTFIFLNLMQTYLVPGNPLFTSDKMNSDEKTYTMIYMGGIEGYLFDKLYYGNFSFIYKLLFCLYNFFE